jgi:hypothetical protein
MQQDSPAKLTASVLHKLFNRIARELSMTPAWPTIASFLS